MNHEGHEELEGEELHGRRYWMRLPTPLDAHAERVMTAVLTLGRFCVSS
jgi:hypothetical protein